ncbi:MAG: hypothetical protein R3F17_15025 [Planctomycetota bacterium]
MQQRLQAALAAMVCTGAAPLWAQTTVPGSLDREAHIPAPVRSALEGLEPQRGKRDGEARNSALNGPIKALQGPGVPRLKDPGDGSPPWHCRTPPASGSRPTFTSSP